MTLSISRFLPILVVRHTVVNVRRTFISVAGHMRKWSNGPFMTVSDGHTFCGAGRDMILGHMMLEEI